MNLTYALTPLIAWLTAGSLKFLINSLKAKRLAFNLIGYGGMPSNHSAIVSSTTTLVGLREGIDSAAFAIALTFACVVMMDAKSLRGHVGKISTAVNAIGSRAQPYQNLRERIGHSVSEILAGILVGIAVALALQYAF